MNHQDPTPPNDANPEPISDAARHAWETTKGKAGEALHTGERYVRENPGTSVLSVFGLGFLFGLVVGWSMAHEESYA